MNIDETFGPYLDTLDARGRQRMHEILSWVATNYPELEGAIKWKQPMFTHHGTFIIGFSTAREHISVAPEVLAPHLDAVIKAGYSHGAKLFRIRHDQPICFELLAQVIELNLSEKAETTTFWRH